MALSCIIKEVKRDIGRTFFNFFSYPLAFDAHVRGGGRTVAMPFGIRKN